MKKTKAEIILNITNTTEEKNSTFYFLTIKGKKIKYLDYTNMKKNCIHFLILAHQQEEKYVFFVMEIKLSNILRIVGYFAALLTENFYFVQKLL